MVYCAIIEQIVYKFLEFQELIQNNHKKKQQTNKKENKRH